MQNKGLIIRLSLTIGGVLLVLILFNQPKVVVEDAESAKTSTSKDQQSGMSTEALAESHSAPMPQLNKTRVSYLINRIKNSVDKNISVIFADSLASEYEKATAFDSLASIRSKIAEWVPEPDRRLQAGEAWFQASRGVGVTQDVQLKYCKEARRYYQLVLDRDPENLLCKTRMAIMDVYTAGAEGRMPMEGINALKNLVTQNPAYPEARFWLGQFQFEIGKTEKSEENFRILVEIDPENIRGLLMFTEVLIKNNKLKEAKEYLMKLKEINTSKDPFIEDYVDRKMKELSV